MGTSDDGPAGQETTAVKGEAVGNGAGQEEAPADDPGEGTKEPVKEDGGLVYTTDPGSIDALVSGEKYNDYLHSGHNYTSSDGTITMDIIDIQYSTIGNAEGVATYASTSIYVIVEITNNGGSVASLDQYDAVLFVDDYEIPKNASEMTVQDNGYCMVNNVPYPTAADIRPGGRKGTIVFVTSFSDGSGITEDSDIEFEISGLVFKINPLFLIDQIKTLLILRLGVLFYPILSAIGVGLHAPIGVIVEDEGMVEWIVGVLCGFADPRIISLSERLYDFKKRVAVVEYELLAVLCKTISVHNRENLSYLNDLMVSKSIGDKVFSKLPVIFFIGGIPPELSDLLAGKIIFEGNVKGGSLGDQRDNTRQLLESFDCRLIS